MRSCARRILLAATISMALVIFCVLLTLAILTRISFVPAMGASVSARRREVFADLLVAGLDVLRELRLVVDLLEEGRVRRLREGLQRRLEFHDPLLLDLVHVAAVHREDRERLLRDRHRRVLLLLHDLGHALAALELAAGSLVEVGSE